MNNKPDDYLYIVSTDYLEKEHGEPVPVVLTVQDMTKLGLDDYHGYFKDWYSADKLARYLNDTNEDQKNNKMSNYFKVFSVRKGEDANAS